MLWRCRVITFQWRHDERDSVSNHQRLEFLLNRLSNQRKHQSFIKSKKTPKLRVTGLYGGNPAVTGGFPSEMASNMENVSIWWRQYEILPATRTYDTLGFWLISYDVTICAARSGPRWNMQDTDYVTLKSPVWEEMISDGTHQTPVLLMSPLLLLLLLLLMLLLLLLLLVVVVVAAVVVKMMTTTTIVCQLFILHQYFRYSFVHIPGIHCKIKSAKFSHWQIKFLLRMLQWISNLPE